MQQWRNDRIITGSICYSNKTRPTSWQDNIRENFSFFLFLVKSCVLILRGKKRAPTIQNHWLVFGLSICKFMLTTICPASLQHSYPQPARVMNAVMKTTALKTQFLPPGDTESWTVVVQSDTLLSFCTVFFFFLFLLSFECPLVSFSFIQLYCHKHHIWLTKMTY